MIKLLACDMDGTVLDERSQIPPETFELVPALAEVGIHFCVSSGRRADTLHDFWGPIADDIDYIASNGTQVIYQGETLRDITFNYDDLVELHRFIRKIDCLCMMVHSTDHRWWMRPRADLLSRMDGWSVPDSAMSSDGTSYEQFAEQIPDEPIFKVLAVNSRPEAICDLVYSLTREMGDRFEFIPYAEDCIDITPKGISKASGLELLMGRYGLVRNEIAAFGDSMNDYEMMRFAGHSYAMENGVYLIKQLATDHLGTNVEHSVQREMARLLDEARAGHAS